MHPPLTETESSMLIAAIKVKDANIIAKEICKNNTLVSAVEQCIFAKLHTELVDICRSADPSAFDPKCRGASVLQSKDFESLKSLTWGSCYGGNE